MSRQCLQRDNALFFRKFKKTERVEQRIRGISENFVRTENVNGSER